MFPYGWTIRNDRLFHFTYSKNYFFNWFDLWYRCHKFAHFKLWCCDLEWLLSSSYWRAFQQFLFHFQTFRDASFAPTPAPSVFRENALTPAEIANHLRDELKRLRRRRQLAGDVNERHSPSPPMSPSSSTSLAPSTSASASEFMMDASESMLRRPATEKPVFTLKQMTMICERMCKVRIAESLPCFYLFFF